MDETGSEFSIDLPEIDPAYGADCPIVRNASLSSTRVSLISVHQDASMCAFNMRFRGLDLFGGLVDGGVIPAPLKC